MKKLLIIIVVIIVIVVVWLLAKGGGKKPSEEVQLTPELAIEYITTRQVVDLSHLVTDDIPTWPGFKPPIRNNLYNLEEHGFFMNVWDSIGEHVGTHIGVPKHFGGDLTLEQVDIHNFIAPLVVIDCSDSVANNPDYQMTVTDIEEWEKANGPIPNGAFVIMKSGWGARWAGGNEAFRNMDEEGVMHFPGLGLEAAKWLVENRNIVGFGHETLGTDYGPSKDFAVEYYLLGDVNRYQVEVLANVDKLPPKGALFVVLPPKFENASGFPARAYAILPDPRPGVDDTKFEGLDLWKVFDYIKNWTWVDLTHTVTADMPTWPGFEPPVRINLYNLEEHGFFMNVWNNVGEHVGTHIGAPKHFGGDLELADIDVSKFVVPFVVIDCSDSVANNPDYQMTVADIQEWESKHGEIPKGAIVIMRSGWGARWEQGNEAFRNTDEEGVMHFPGLGLEAAKWLVENRDIVGFGHETLGTDYGPSKDFAVEYYLLGDANRYQVEVLANVDKLPETGGIFLLGAPKFANASGFPARAIAIFPPTTK